MHSFYSATRITTRDSDLSLFGEAPAHGDGPVDISPGQLHGGSHWFGLSLPEICSGDQPIANAAYTGVAVDCEFGVQVVIIRALPPGRRAG